jgi:mannose-6-phosphate isomerase-like protein (cupin superfamily)
VAVSEPQDPEQIQADTSFQTFKIRPQLLSAGKQTTVLAKTDVLTGTVMVADTGGETIVHAHQAMDQMFVVLAGRARFYSSLDEVAAELGPMEGILVPRGATYWYEKISEENMVLFRAAAIAQLAERTTVRFSEQLKPLPPPVVREGEYFEG